jgi:hypothetical protein
MLYNEIVVVYGNNQRDTNTFCGQNAEFVLDLALSNHCVLKA